MINTPLVLLVLLTLTTLDTSEVPSILIFTFGWAVIESLTAYAPSVHGGTVSVAQVSMVFVGCVCDLYAPSQVLVDLSTVHQHTSSRCNP